MLVLLVLFQVLVLVHLPRLDDVSQGMVLVPVLVRVRLVPPLCDGSGAGAGSASGSPSSSSSGPTEGKPNHTESEIP